jgi:galactokinase
MCCQEGHALQFDTLDNSITQLPMNLAEHGLALLLIRTNADRSLREAAYAERRQSVENAAASLGLPSLRRATPADLDALQDGLIRRRAEHVIRENQRVQLAIAAFQRGDFAELGTLMTASHASLRDVFEVSSEQLDLAVHAALSAGALGARMTGAGFGGSVIVLVDSSVMDSLTAAVKLAFSQRAIVLPEFEVVVPCNGALREL